LSNFSQKISDVGKSISQDVSAAGKAISQEVSRATANLTKPSKQTQKQKDSNIHKTSNDLNEPLVAKKEKEVVIKRDKKKNKVSSDGQSISQVLSESNAKLKEALSQTNNPKSSFQPISPDDQNIFHAAQAGNIEGIQQLIAKEGIEVIDKRDEKKNTPFIMAAYSGQIATMQFLIDNGAKVKKTNISGQTALYAAAQGRQIEAFRWLEKNHPQLKKKKDGSFTTAYMMAAGKKFPVSIYKDLPDKLFYAKNAGGDDLLSYAVYGNNIDLINYYFSRSQQQKKFDISMLSAAYLANFDHPPSKPSLEILNKEYCSYVYNNKTYIPDHTDPPGFSERCNYNFRELIAARKKQ
jgi:ankyrin repeat protein